MSTKHQPAFPCQQQGLDAYGMRTTLYMSGMNLRQYTAIQAMKGLLANSYDGGRYGRPLSQASNREIAAMAVQQADALLSALEENNNA